MTESINQTISLHIIKKLIKINELMIQNDIDLLEQVNNRYPYFFCLQLLNLNKNKKKHLKKSKKNTENSHFKFIIEQDDYIVDQTKHQILNVFSAMRTTSMSLNRQILQFYLHDVKQTNAEFQLKLYSISHHQVQQLGNISINTLIYIEVFLEDGKTCFKQTVSLSPDYSLEYEIFVEKSKLELQNLMKNRKEQNFTLRNAFKKKGGQIIQVQNQRVEIKHKMSEQQSENVLRKSLHINNKTLFQIQMKKQQLKQRSQQLSLSRSSVFSKISNMFKPKTNDMNQDHQTYSPSKNKKCIVQTQKSFAILPPSIAPPKYPRPQNQSYYHNLKMQRRKQRQRIQRYSNGIDQTKIYLKQSNSYSWSKMLKIIVFVLLFTIVVFYLANPTKKGKSKWIGKLDLSNL